MDHNKTFEGRTPQTFTKLDPQLPGTLNKKRVHTRILKYYRTCSSLIK